MMTLDNKLPLHRRRRKLKRRPVDQSQHLITLNLKTYFVENNGRFRMPRLLVTTRPLETMNMTEEKGCVAFIPQRLGFHPNLQQHFCTQLPKRFATLHLVVRSKKIAKIVIQSLCSPSTLFQKSRFTNSIEQSNSIYLTKFRLFSFL